MSEWEDVADEWEDVPSAGVWTRPQEGADPGDVGPPSEGVALEAKDPSLKRTVSIPEAIAAPFGEGVAGIPVAAAAGAVDAISNKQNLLDAYRKRREQQKYQAKLAREQRPWSSLAGGLADAVGETMLAGAALPGEAAQFIAQAPAAQRAALETLRQVGTMGANDYARSGAGTTTVDAARRGTEDVLGGQLLGLMGEAISQPIKNAGKGLQWPQRAGEWLADKVGGTRAGQSVANLGGEPKEIGDKYVSERVRDLRKTIDAGEIGDAAASQVDDSMRAIGSFADKRLSNLSPSETKALAQEFDALLKVRGAQSSSPEKLLSNWDDFLRTYDLNPAKATAADVIRAVNKRDASHVATMGTNMAARNRALGIADNQIDSFKDMFGGAERSRADFLAGKASRTGEALSGDAGKAQFRLSELERALSTPEDKLALRLAKAAEAGTADIGPGGFAVDPREFGDDFVRMTQDASKDALDKFYPRTATAPPAKAVGSWMTGAKATGEPIEAPVADRWESAWRPIRRAEKELQQMSPQNPRRDFAEREIADLKDTYSAAGARRAANLQADTSNVLERARELQGKLKEYARMAEDESLSEANRKRLELLGSKAQAELDRITTGRAAISKGLGIGGGLAAGSAGGVLAGIGGAGAGAAAFRTADMLGALGQKMAGGQSNFERVAEMAKQIAQDAPESPMGRAAMWALGGGPARLAAFAADPYVRDHLDR